MSNYVNLTTINASGPAGWGAIPPIGSIVAWNGTGFNDSSNGSPTTNNLGNSLIEANLYIGQNWKVCDGSTVTDIDSPFTGRHLPNIADSRFIMGTSTAPSTGGANSQASNVTVSTQPAFTVDSHNHSIAHTHSVLHIGRNLGIDTYYLNSSNSISKTSITSSDSTISDSYSVQSGGGAIVYGFNQSLLTSDYYTTGVLSPPNGSDGSGALSGNSTASTTRTTNVALTNNAVENRPLYFACFYIMRIK